MAIKRETVYRRGKYIAGIVIGVAMFIFLGKAVYGSYQNEVLKEDVMQATLLLESVLEESYIELEREVIDMVHANDYDYALTMQSFYDNGNPYKDVDYIKLIAQYVTIKEYCIENEMPIGTGISEIPFLNLEVEEKEIERLKPFLNPTYTLSTDGFYYLTGNEVITEEKEVFVFEQVLNDPYHYIETGTAIVGPTIETVAYAEIKISFISDSDIYKKFGVLEEDVKAAYEIRHQAIDNAVNNKALQQSIFINSRATFKNCSELSEEQVKNLINQAPVNTQDILKVAVSLVGEVPYEWGGKASGAGYDLNWWTFKENGQQKGLDCSGYVQWVYMTSGYPKNITDKLLSTETMLLNLTDKAEHELAAGDIGLLNQGEGTNHTGIYLGDGYWIHCSSSKKTVVIEKYTFNHYKAIEKNECNVDNEVLKLYYHNYSNEKYTKSIENTMENAVLLAQLMEHEAANQGFNGWVGIGEVVMNRLHSDKFPNTVREIIYQPGQFSKSEEIQYIIPRDEVLQAATDILNGSLRYFNNVDVLYFKNPMITDGIRPEVKQDWNGLKYYGYINEHAYYTQE